MAKPNERDEKILEHIGRYRISLRPVLERWFFEGKNSGNVIQRLLKNDRIYSRDGLPNRIRYYQLSASEAKRRSIPVNRTEPYAAQALNLHLGMLWLCCFGEGDFQRVEEKLLRGRFKDQPPTGPHCIERSETGHVLWHIRSASADTDDTNLIRRMKSDVQQAYENQELANPIQAGQYGFIVLVDTRTRVRALERTLDDHEFVNDAQIHVAFAPSHVTLPQALREL